MNQDTVLNPWDAGLKSYKKPTFYYLVILLKENIILQRTQKRLLLICHITINSEKTEHCFKSLTRQGLKNCMKPIFYFLKMLLKDNIILQRNKTICYDLNFIFATVKLYSVF